MVLLYAYMYLERLIKGNKIAVEAAGWLKLSEQVWSWL